jgi:leucyl/phenylalanyl-tRNA--protein transferase
MATRVKNQTIPPEVLLQAYAGGYFPMADSRYGRIEWYTADPRAVLPLDPFHVPRRLQRSLKKALPGSDSPVRGTGDDVDQ